MTTMVDKLFFYSKSRNVLPGKGANESVQDINMYPNLCKIKDWRKVLSNFNVHPFEYEGKTYNSIEHVFQAKKIELVDKEKSLLFTVESDSEIGKGDGEIARKHRKLVKLDKDMLYKWSQIRDKIMEDAATCKYQSCEEARNVLIATNQAELWHIVSRSNPVRFEHLERIRSSMK
jgi:ribA/ribD-fused uncharacterized protein